MGKNIGKNMGNKNMVNTLLIHGKKNMGKKHGKKHGKQKHG
jgi:hypothetical protein